MNKIRTVLAITGALALLVGLAFAANFASKWNKPLGVSLGLPSPTLAATRTPVPIATSSRDATTTISSTFTSTPEPLCGGPSVMTILAIGSDTRSENYLYGLSDVIRVIRVDFNTPRVSVLDLPRDLWVDIPDISSHYGINQGKLNQAYLYGNPGMGYYDGPGEGPGLLARTLFKNFGISVDNYGAINMRTFVKLVDAAGGIDIYLPTDMDGRPIDKETEDMGYFSAGQQHLGGDAALRLARIRKKIGGGFRRTDNQNLVLCALKDKLLSPSVLPKVPQIIDSFRDSVQTDLSPAQISRLACLMPKVSSENLIFASVPEELFKLGKIYDPYRKDTTSILEIDHAVLQNYINRFIAGEWPEPSTDEPSCPPPVKQP